MADLTPDQAIQTLRGLPEDRQRAILGKLSPEVKRGILTKLSASKPAPDPEERTAGNYASEVARGVGRGIKNDVVGLGQTVMHPIDTVTGLITQTGDAASAAAKEFRNTSGAPITQRLAAGTLAGLENAPIIGGMVQHAEQGGDRMASPESVGAAAEGITTFAAPELAGKAVGPLTKGLSDTSRSLRSAITGTGPKVTAKLVEEAKSGNAAADAHLRTQSAIETARNNALKEGNQKYKAVNEKLDPEVADQEKMGNAVDDAMSKLKGSEAVPPMLKDIAERVSRSDSITSGGVKFGPGTPLYESVKAQGGLPKSEALSYRDLQGYYSDLGTALSKGNLPGDVYAAMDTLHESIGNEMQRIAETKGLGPQLNEARTHWRRMKQTFGKPMGNNDAATGVLRSESPEMAHAQEVSDRIRMLGSFDPEIPKHFENLRKAREVNKGNPTAVPGETRKIGAQDVREAKAESLSKKADSLRTSRSHVANTLAAFGVIRDALHGNVAGIGTDIAARAIYGGAKMALANVLERPEVVKALTNPTAQDIAAIPPEMRGDFPAILEAAKAKGIKVDPRIGAVLGITAMNGAKSKKLLEISDAYR